MVTQAGTRECLALLADLDIETDASTRERALRDPLHIACRHDPAAYDAADLELALREGLSLATLDQDLLTATVTAAGARGSSM